MSASTRTAQQKMIDAINLLQLDIEDITSHSVKTAYRKMALQYHPDRKHADGGTNRENKTAMIIFQEINNSNEIVKRDLDNGGHLVSGCQAILRMQGQNGHKEHKEHKAIDPNSLVYDTQDLFEPKTKPYIHQAVAFNRFRDTDYFALFMDMGTGKTKTCIDIATYKYLLGEIDALMIIAPNHVHTQWVNEQFPIHCSIPYEAFVWEQKKWNSDKYRTTYDKFTFDKSNVLKVFAMNVEAFQGKPGVQFTKYFLSENRTFIVLDESTRIKAPEAKRSIEIRKLHTATCRAILTGTPTAKSPLDIWSPFNFLKDDYFNMSWMKFRARYSVMIKDQASKRMRQINDYEFERVRRAIATWQGEGDLYTCLGEVAQDLGMSFNDVRFVNDQEENRKFKDDNVLKDLIGPDTFSVKIEDCMDLPPKVYEKIELDMAPDQKKVYDQLVHYMAAQVKLVDGDTAELTVTAVIALIRRFMQVCGGFFPEKIEGKDKPIYHPFKKNVKLESLIEDIEDSCSDKQIIVWAEHQHEIQLIKQRLIDEGYTADTYYGPDSKEKKERTMEQFKAGNIQFLVANPTVAGYGLNLQNCTHQYFFCNTYRTEARIQAEARSYRAGQTHTCVYKDILIKDSIDYHIYAILKEGKELNDIFKSIDDIYDYL